MRTRRIHEVTAIASSSSASSAREPHRGKHINSSQVMAKNKSNRLHKERRSSTSAPWASFSTQTQIVTSAASANLILPRHLTGELDRPAAYYPQPSMTTYYTPWGQSFVMPYVDTPGYSDFNNAVSESSYAAFPNGNQFGVISSFGSHPYPSCGSVQTHPFQNRVVSEDAGNQNASMSGAEIFDGNMFAVGEGDDCFDGATLYESATGNHGDSAYLGYALPLAENCIQEGRATAVPYQVFEQGQPETYSGIPLDDMRKEYGLHAIAKQVSPTRLNNALYGRYINITDEESGRVFLHHVPKKMLILFIGRERVSKFLKTLSEHDKSEQVLRLPPGSTSHVGLKILIAWMTRACKEETMDSIEPIRIPKHFFAAISLARTLDLFGLHQDRDRVDRVLNAHHYRRPLFLDCVMEIWKLLPKDSKYTFRMIKQLSESLEANERGHGRDQPDKEEILAFLEENPALKARVLDRNENGKWVSNLPRTWASKKGNKKQLKHKGEGIESPDTNMETDRDADTPEWKQYQQRKKTPPVLNLVFTETW